VLTDPSGRFTGEFQASSHPHAAVFHPSEPVLVVPDKGTDTVTVLHLDRDTRRLSVAHRWAAAPGSGPRHAAFHPTLPVIYVANELTPSVTVLAWDATWALAPVQTIPTIAGPPQGVIWPSEVAVHPSGRFLHVSNRGPDTIATFPIRPDGTLGEPREVGSGGRTPRTFGVDPSGAGMVVLNQDSGSIVAFAIGSDGSPSPIGVVASVERPVSVVVGRY
jgi:6-phosphogluconolactonase